MRKVKVLTRARKDPPRPVGAGGSAVDLMIELVSCHLCLPSSAPLTVFGTGNGRWSPGGRRGRRRLPWGTVVGLVGARAEDYVFHSRRDWRRNSLVGWGGYTRGLAA